MRRVQESTRLKLIETAKNLFLEKGIQEVTIYDIAKEANIGEATVYRYFGKKINLVMSAAASMSNDIKNEYFSMDINENGYKAIERFYKIYLYFYSKNTNYFRFLNEFDLFLETESHDNNIQYEESIDDYKFLYMTAYNKGIKDGSIKVIDDIDTFYYSTTLSLLNLCKKVTKVKILTSDKTYDDKKLIEALINIILNNLRR